MVELDEGNRFNPRNWNRLFHQKRDGTFEDVTEKAGLTGTGLANSAQGLLGPAESGGKRWKFADRVATTQWPVTYETFKRTTDDGLDEVSGNAARLPA